jgi:hypothetical protein
VPEPDEFERLLRDMDPQEVQRIRDAHDRMVARLAAWAAWGEEGVIGQPYGLTQRQGTEHWQIELGLDGVMDSVARELPVTWRRDLPMVPVWATRRRLRPLLVRSRSRSWLARRGLARTYLAVRYSVMYERPLTQIINTIRVA